MSAEPITVTDTSAAKKEAPLPGPPFCVAALFVETNGVYFGDENVDPWDVIRDAMKFEGGLPVVAHPPCSLWGPMAKINFKRYGGEHNRPGNDGGMFAKALAAIDENGGVLEHPAYSNAFEAHGVMKPRNGVIGWQQTPNGRWVCEVWQSAYGHRARKKTWLVYVGKNRPFDLIWDRTPGTHQISKDHKMKTHKPQLSKKEAKATPRPFADTLIMLAQHAMK